MALVRISGRTGPYFEILEARSPDSPSEKVHLGVRYDTFRRYATLGLSSAIAQYYGIVQDGLMDAKHAFRGLVRPLMHNGDADADRTVIIYSWRPEADWEWRGDRFSGQVVRLEPPTHRVFVVLVREEEPGEFGVAGSIEKWNWIMEDLDLSEAPVEWGMRYGEKLWTRGGP